ncbi:GIY-YIG nuclease family protein [Christensenellaceae bacterium OttesenSCG-928-L17]|nr:GIY-YIG nuclease family protein [Christensenellaceae bacterium OttesenSCG-928-L17]
MNPNERKAAARAYKEQATVGGLYRIHNTKTGWKSAILATPNMQGQRNKLAFSKKTNAVFDPSFQAQWTQYGADAFELEELELLKQKPDQSTKEFREDLAALLELWEQKNE